MPVKTRKRDFRLTIAEDEAIAQNAAKRGMGTATYIRARALHDEQILFDTIQRLASEVSEIHAHLLGEQPRRKCKPNPAAHDSRLSRS